LTPPRPGNHPAGGGDPEPSPSASPLARLSNASRTVYRQTDPRTGAKLGRPRGRYPTFADHVARLMAAEPHATAERFIEVEREAARCHNVARAWQKSSLGRSQSRRRSTARSMASERDATPSFW
jgi:hypothetical protein